MLLLTKHINRGNSGSRRDNLRDEYFGSLTLLYKFRRRIHKERPFSNNLR